MVSVSYSFAPESSEALKTVDYDFRGLRILPAGVPRKERWERKMKAVMATEADYRSRAKECIELAILARTSEQRVMLEHIAATWVRLADERANKSGFRFFGNGTVHTKA